MRTAHAFSSSETLSIESLFELLACSVQSTFHCSYLTVEDLPHFQIGKPFEVPKYQHGPVKLRHVLQYLVNLLPQLFSLQDLDRGRRCRASRIELRHTLDSVEVENSLALASQVVAPDVDRHGENPRASVPFRPERRRPTIDAQERLLAEIEGHVPIAHESVDEVHDAILVALQQLVEACLIAHGDPYQAVAIAGPVGRVCGRARRGTLSQGSSHSSP